MSDVDIDLLRTGNNRNHIPLDSRCHGFDVEVGNNRSAERRLDRRCGRAPRKNEKPDLNYQCQQHEEDTDRDDPLHGIGTVVRGCVERCMSAIPMSDVSVQEAPIQRSR